LLRLVDEDGRRRDVDGFPVDLDPAGLRDLYRRMVVARRVDRQATMLTRQGQLAVFPSAVGQEATEVGAVLALADRDWLFPTYRETVALVARGLDPVEVLGEFAGTWHCDYDPQATRVAPMCTPLATQTVHAVGLAMASRMRGDDVVALAFLGDGASSEGDAHEAMNFASVFGAPCVFVLQNNQYAISVPLGRQTHAPTLAHKGVGYGMPGYRVDGNDALAVYAAVRRAVEQARAGGGPSLVEAVTYRVEPHTNSDDPSRYRSAKEVEAWKAKDPITRFERYLVREKVLDDRDRHGIATEAEQIAADIRARISERPPNRAGELFQFVYAEPTAALVEQRDSLERELSDCEDGEEVT
jgi:pyruvate dehydrogenase E1 component alpha subunit